MPDATPIRFDPSLETSAPDEAETQAELVATMRGILATTSRNYGHAVRSVHAKSHALLEGEMHVGTLPPELAQGAFARPGTFPVVMRLSTNPGDILDDAVSAPRGLAVKVIGVAGPRLPGSEGAETQDFVMANAPAFAAPDAKTFLKNLKLLAATTDRAETAKIVLSTALRGLGTALGAAGITSPTVNSLGGQKLTHPLGETFYSQAPLRWGDHVGKVSVAPASPNLRALADQPIRLGGNPNALRQAAIDALAHEGGEWDVRVQLCTDPATMPIEDASIPWPEDASPYRTVARIRVPAQPAWSEQRAEQADDRLAFSPWHGLAAHQPLGSVNRSRRPAYAEASADRAARNGDTLSEPTAAVGLSDAPANAVGTTPGREGRRNARRRRDTRGLRAASGALGGLAGGVLVSAFLFAKQRWTGQASDFVQQQNQVAPSRWSGNEAASYAGHLLLSAATGAAYGALKPAGAAPVPSGLALGLGLGVTHVAQLAYARGDGPADLLPRRLGDHGTDALQHLVVNALFGLVTALVTDAATRHGVRRRRP